MISCANVGTYCWFLAQFRVFVFWGGDGGIFILFLLRLLQSAMSVHFLSQLGLGLVNVFPCTDLPADFIGVTVCSVYISITAVAELYEIV